MLLKYSILLSLLGWISISGVTPNRKVSMPVANSAMKVSAPNPAALAFDKDVKPIFEQHCNPCHFPGGKMYERLPFDQATTIINHEEGILKRIKDSVEVKTIREFVEQNSSAIN
jgi:hypothetical protein